MISSCDIAIVGGAVIGSSVAFHLARRLGPETRIVVVEADHTYAGAASALSAASIRQQFSSPVNVEISMYGIGFLRDIAHHLAIDGEVPDIGLHEGGYLFLATEAGEPILEENFATATALGADLALLRGEALTGRFPWLSTEGIAAGTAGLSGEGWFDGYGLMRAFRLKAQSLGVHYLEARVERLQVEGGACTGLTLSDGSMLCCGTVMLSAGADVTRLLAPTGPKLPVRSRKRMIFTFETREKLANFPLLIDPTGVYVRPEGSGYLCGTSPPPDADPDSTEFEVEWPIFEEIIWPVLANRVPAFENIRPGRAWAGHYDLNLFDHNAFIGAVPGIAGAYMATGFSGHGMQQAPAVGRGLAELISEGRYATLDLSPLGCERLLAGHPLIERNVV